MPDPERPGKARKSWLYTFLNDCSRYCPYGRFVLIHAAVVGQDTVGGDFVATQLAAHPPL